MASVSTRPRARRGDLARITLALLLTLSATLSLAAAPGGAGPSLTPRAYLPLIQLPLRLAYAYQNGLYTIMPDGTARTQLAGLGLGDDLLTHLLLAWSPDGARIAFTQLTPGPGGRALRTIASDGTDRQTLAVELSTASHMAWSPDGSRIAFSGSGPQLPWGIYMVAADGSAAPLLFQRNTYVFSWSPNGDRLAYAWSPGGLDPQSYLFVKDADGTDPRQISTAPVAGETIAWRPDGTQIAFIRATPGGAWQVALADLDDGAVTPVADCSETCRNLEWSPDGQRLVFEDYQNLGEVGASAIVVVAADGTGRARLTDESLYAWFPRWSPDGRRIAFSAARQTDLTGAAHIYVVGADGTELRYVTEGLGAIWQP